MLEEVKKRVQEEFEELNEKLNKLDSFIEMDRRFLELSQIQRTLLIVQKDAMQTYASILYERLQNF